MTNFSIKIYGFVTGLLRRNEEGQDLIEYALIGGLIAIAIIGAFVAFGGTDGFVQDMVDNIGACIDFDGDDCDISI